MSWTQALENVSKAFQTDAAPDQQQPKPITPTVNPAQPGALSQDVMAGVSNLTGNQGGFQSGAVTYQPVRTWSGGGVEQGGGPGEIESIIAYNTADANQVGKSYQVYDPSGKYQRDGQFQEVNNGRDFMQALAGAAAIYGLGGMMSAASGGAGGLAGETLSKAALDGTSAFGANSVPGAFELGSAGGAASGAGSGLGSGLSDLGLGDIANTGGVNMMGTPVGAASAPLPMGQGGWAAATMPAAGSTPATGMMFDPTAGLTATASSPWTKAISAAEKVADNPLTKLGVETALRTAGGVGASGELTPEEKARIYRNLQIADVTTNWRR